MARAQVELPQPVDLRPQAAPIDTYSRPAKSSLWDAAAGLAEFDRGLRGFIDQVNSGKQAEADRLAGEAAFYKNPEGNAEAVRRGSIPAFASPHFVAGFKNAQGTSAGYDLEVKAAAAFDAWDGKGTDNPEEFRKWQQEFLKSNIGTNDPEVIRGLLPHIRSVMETTTNQWVKYRHEQTLTGSLATHVTAGFKAAQNPTLYGKPYDWNGMLRERDAFVAQGGDPNEFDKLAAEQAAIAATTGEGDEAALKFFDQKVPGKDYTYGEEPTYGRKLLETARDKLQTMKHAAINDGYEQARREDKQATDAATRQIVGMLVDDPKAVIPEDVLKQGERNNPDIRVQIADWRNKLGSGFTDPKDMQQVYSDIMGDPANGIPGMGMTAVHNAMKNGVFGRPEDLKAARDFAQSMEGDPDRVKNVLERQSVRAALDSIKVDTTAKGDLMNPISGLSREGEKAQYDLRHAITMWVIQHPEASDLEIEEAVGKINARIRDAITAPEIDSGGSYQRPEGLGFSNPYDKPAPQDAPQAAPEAQQPQAAPTQPAQPATPYTGGRGPQPPAPAATVDDDAAMEFYDGLQPEQKAQLRAAAKSSGRPLMDFLKSMATTRKQSALEQPEAGNVQLASFTPDDTANLVNETFGTRFKGSDVEEIVAALGGGGELRPEDFARSVGRALESLPAGLRNNNPGNIKYVATSTLGRMLGPSKNTDQGDPQAVYASPQEGTAAAARLLLRKFDRGRDTVEKLIASQGGWTPGNREAARNIAKYAGFAPDQKIDLRQPQTLQKVMRAIFMQEQGDDNKLYGDDVLRRGALAALGVGNSELGPTADTRKVLLSALTSDKGVESIDRMKPKFASGLAQLITSAPPEVRNGLQIYSGYRSVERQKELWEASDKTGRTVARPGHSQHNHGNAADLMWNGKRLDRAPLRIRQWIHLNAPRFGLNFPMDYEAWHIEDADARRSPLRRTMA